MHPSEWEDKSTRIVVTSMKEDPPVAAVQKVAKTERAERTPKTAKPKKSKSRSQRKTQPKEEATGETLHLL